MDNLVDYIRNHTGLTVTAFAEAIGRDRQTVRNWWDNQDPLLRLAVAGYSALKVKPGQWYYPGALDGPVVVHGPYLVDLLEEAEHAGHTLQFLAGHLEGRMGDGALAEMECNGRDTAEAVNLVTGGREIGDEQ